MRRLRAARALAVLAAGVALADLALAAATQLALGSAWLLGRIDADPVSLFVSWDAPRASLRPGRVRFASLMLRSRDPNVEWEARLSDVTVDVSLLELPARRFHATSVRAASLAFRLRERLTDAEATGARLARYPPITGFPDPPLLDAAPPGRTPGDPWSVRVDALAVARLHEIWIGSWRFTGDARVAGGFFLRPGTRAEVFPSELAVVGGTLAWGRESVSRGLAGFVRTSLPRFDTQAYPGNEVWKIVSGEARLDGTLDGLAFLAPSGSPPVSGGDGRFAARVSLESGSGRGRLDASAGRLVARFGPHGLRGAARARVLAPRIDFPGETVAFDGTRLDLSTVADGAAAGWSGSITAPRARLDLSPVALDSRVEARLGDGRPLVALVPKGPPRWLAGLLDLRDFGVRARLDASEAALAVTRAHAEAGTFSLDADFRRVGTRSWGALLARKGPLALGVGFDADGSSVHPAGASWFEAQGRPGGLRTAQPREAVAPRRAR